MQLLQVFGKKQVARSWYKVLWIIIICTSSFSFFILWACDLLPLTVGSTALWCDRWLPLLPLFHLIWSKWPWGAWWLINSHISWLSAWNVGFLNDSHFREASPTWSSDSSEITISVTTKAAYCCCLTFEQLNFFRSKMLAGSKQLQKWFHG